MPCRQALREQLRPAVFVQAEPPDLGGRGRDLSKEMTARGRGRKIRRGRKNGDSERPGRGDSSLDRLTLHFFRLTLPFDFAQGREPVKRNQ